MYDALIVGARCAGSPLAMLLARRGYRVLVLDRATFPSDTMSTHFIQPPGIARLQKWGLLDDIVATGCPTIGMGVFEFGDQRLEAPNQGVASIPFTIAPRRTVLDKLLGDVARREGAEIREGHYVDGLITEDGAVVGVSGHTNEGEEFEETAKFVVGADGRNSKVAELAGAKYLEFHEPVCCGYYGYWRGDFPEAATFRVKDDRCLITFPTHDAEVIIATWKPDLFKEKKKDPQRSLIEAYSDTPEIFEALNVAKLDGNVLGAALPSFVRESAGPGWALIGDAAYHKDPTPADGINDAFRSVDYLADALDEALSGKTDAEVALKKYGSERAVSTSKSLPATIDLSAVSNELGAKVNAFLALGAWRGGEAEALAQGS